MLARRSAGDGVPDRRDTNAEQLAALWVETRSSTEPTSSMALCDTQAASDNGDGDDSADELAVPRWMLIAVGAGDDVPGDESSSRGS